MEKVNVEIKGISALLMHRYPIVPVEGIDKLPTDRQAEEAAYRTEDGNLYVPGLNLQRALVAGATFSKGKGRATLQKPVAACVFIFPEILDLGKKDYAIDSRRVVVPATRGAIIRHRPRLDEWKLSFDIEWDETLVSEKQLREIVDNTGSRVGLLDFRPEKKGPFGRFIVIKWKR